MEIQAGKDVGYVACEQYIRSIYARDGMEEAYAPTVAVERPTIVIDSEESPKPEEEERFDDSGLKGLSSRAYNAMRILRIKDKNQAAQMIKSGELKINAQSHPRKIRGYGLKTHAEICTWAGVPVPKKKSIRVYFESCPHCNCKLY